MFMINYKVLVSQASYMIVGQIPVRLLIPYHIGPSSEYMSFVKSWLVSA